jgi:hypothetical protein
MSKTTGIVEKNMKSFSKLFVLSLTIVAFLLAATAAKADTYPLTITFDSAVQTGLGGQTFTFDGIITNVSGSLVNLSSDSFTLAAGSVSNDFFLTTPASLAAGASSSDLALFAITVAQGTPVGLYTEVYQILDGSTVVGDVTFDIYITPEPGTILLLGTGLLLLAGLIRWPRWRMPKQKTLTPA